MINSLLKPLVLILFGTFIFCFYYLVFGHIEAFSLNYIYYFLFMFSVLIIYNFYIFYLKENKSSIGLFFILGYFFLSLLVLSILFFVLNNPNNVLNYNYGFILFFKIISYLLVPIIIFFITTSFGKKITKYLPKIDDFSSVFKLVLSLNLGFISFVTLIILGSFLGLYNIYFIIFLLLLFSIISYKEIIENAKMLFNFKLKSHIDEGRYFKFFSSQVLFTIFSLVLGVALISIFRPFPIGWDDLGVYMNYPKQLSENGGMISLGAMYAWQFFTGIGYMLGSPTFAFFLNISGTFLSFIVLNLVISEFLNKYMKKEDEESFISLPLLLSTLFVSLPMVVFQTSKDMKLDIGLFFISISAIYLLFSYILNIKNLQTSPQPSPLGGEGVAKTESGKLKTENGNLIYLFIIGVLVGFAFSVKFTSLLLIISLLALIFYFRLGLLGFFSFFSIFIGIFTYLNLWKMMNVVINPNNITGLETKLGVSFLVFGVILFVVKVFIGDKNILSKKVVQETPLNFPLSKGEIEQGKTKNMTVFFKEIGIFLLGIFIILLPWFGKNISETYPDISISGLLSGKGNYYKLDLEKIKSKEEIEKIKNKYIDERKKENLVTTNEDFLRYLGYESGILNYVFLPWNLTMQKNQGGEFTDISFVFLALIPLIFIFLPFKNRYFYLFFVFLIFLQIMLVLRPDYKNIENSKLSFLSLEEKTSIFINNNNILNSIFSIKSSDYFSDDLIESSRGKNSFSDYKKSLEKVFYNDLQNKVISKDTSLKLPSLNNLLMDVKDLDNIKQITKNYHNSYVFFHSDIVNLEKAISNLPLEKQQKILQIWSDYRTLNGEFIDLFAKINIPFGYFIVFLAFLLPFLFLIYSVKDTKNNYLFKLNLVFSFIYTFLWTISAFGIVWYGISMYFSFLLMISFSSYYFVYYKKDEDKDSINIKFISSIILFIIVSSYLIVSVIPHSFLNLKSAGYSQYKNGEIKYPSAVFDYHKNYVEILSRLNIAEDKVNDFVKSKVSKSIKLDYTKKLNLAGVVYSLKVLKSKNTNNLELLKEIENSLDNIYFGILNPQEEFRSKEYIYRAGTFLKYYISDNYNRLFGDSLLYNLNDYIYSDNVDETIENFKKLGISYMVVDLNAATIDKSKTHDLTKRYEKMLKTFTSSDLELISTDSVCLMVGLEYYKKTKNIKEYMYVAGVNYDSYDENNRKISRNQKYNSCIKFIIDLKESNSINDNNYPFLKGFINLKTPQEVANKIGRSSQVIFKIK